MVVLWNSSWNLLKLELPTCCPLCLLPKVSLLVACTWWSCHQCSVDSKAVHLHVFPFWSFILAEYFKNLANSCLFYLNIRNRYLLKNCCCMIWIVIRGIVWVRINEVSICLWPTLKTNRDAVISLSRVCCRLLLNVLPRVTPSASVVVNVQPALYGIFHTEWKQVVTHNDKLSDWIRVAVWCLCIMYEANVQSDAEYAAKVNITAS